MPINNLNKTEIYESIKNWNLNNFKKQTSENVSEVLDFYNNLASLIKNVEEKIYEEIKKIIIIIITKN